MDRSRRIPVILMALVLLVVVAITPLAGCQSPTATPTVGPTAGTTPTVKADWLQDTSPVTITVYTDRGWGAPWTDNVAKKVTALTGVTLDMQIPVKDEDSEKISLMMASKDFPDMMLLNSGNSTIEIMQEQGLLKDVEVLMDGYAPNMKADIMKYGDAETLTDPKLRATNGKLYQLGIAYQGARAKEVAAAHGSLYPMWMNTWKVRQSWLDEIGNPVIHDGETLYQALKAMKSKHPTAIGLQVQNFDDFFCQFGLWKNSAWSLYEVDGSKNVTAAVKGQKYKEVMQFCFKLAQEGLLAQEGFINPYDILQANFINGTALGINGNFAPQYGTTPETIGDTVSTAIPPFDTYAFTFGPPGPWMTQVIPTSGKNSDRVIQFLAYCASPEGQLMLTYGGAGGAKGDYKGDKVNGPFYYFEPLNSKSAAVESEIYPNGRPVFDPTFWADMQKDWAGLQAINGVSRHIYMKSQLYNTANMPGDPTDKEIAFTTLMKPHVFYNKGEFYFNIETNSDLGVIAAKYDTLRNEYQIKMVFAKDQAQFDTLFNEMQTKIDQIGLASLEAEWTAQYKVFTK